MSKKNPEYDFKWCPGCGDFGVKRAIEWATEKRNIELEVPMENTVVVAGIGCSGNLVHLLDGTQPFGIHGLHGRTLPVAFGVKMGNPDLNVIIVSGDGDFLSIGGEHIAPQAQRNLNVTAIIMDNGVYGLTKGQSSPTTFFGEVTPSTPYGKIEQPLNPLELYLSVGVNFIASGFSSSPRKLADLINQAMSYDGFSIVHVQSPCTTYNDNFDILKGNAKKGIAPVTWEVSDDYDPSDRQKAQQLISSGGIPLGVIYQNPDARSLDSRFAEMVQKVKVGDLEQQMNVFAI
jgi:2-oxoglutarate ferredoxin oxidoreductase subunit beta